MNVKRVDHRNSWKLGGGAPGVYIQDLRLPMARNSCGIAAVCMLEKSARYYHITLNPRGLGAGLRFKPPGSMKNVDFLAIRKVF